MSTLLARAAESAAPLDFLMAHPLAAFRRRTGLSHTAVAAWLGCGVRRLDGLALCVRPDADQESGGAQVIALARYIGCSAERLSLVLGAARLEQREGDAHPHRWRRLSEDTPRFSLN